MGYVTTITLWVETSGDPNADIFKKEEGIGKIYEVDLEYPSDLHHLHNDYPCAAQKIEVTGEMLSDYCKKIKNDYKISSGNVHKLILTLSNKEKYVLHEEDVKLYLRLGLKLKGVHRVLQFSEKPWLKVKLVIEGDQLLKLSSKPTYASCKIFHENLVAVNMKKERLKLDKPSYFGMCVLDLSKALMYDFHYNFTKKKYGDLAKLLFTDTDSLCYHIQTDDVYEDFYRDKGLFDNSEYEKSSEFFLMKIKKK